MPRLSRGHYRRELAASAFLPVMMGVVEGGMVSVIAKNAFEGDVPDGQLNFAVAVLAGAPAFANITSFLWASLSNGRDKIRFLFGLQLTAVLLVMVIAFAPMNLGGLFLLTACVVGVRICWAGVVTIRSTVWRANYPRSARAKMAGKLATVQALMIAGVGWMLAEAMTYDERAFRLVYPVAALFGLTGAWIYRSLRVRGHRAMMNAERIERGPNTARLLISPMGIWRVLRDDRNYRQFMICMFIFGTGNMMITAPLVIMLREVFNMGYRGGMLISGVVPIVIMPLSIPIWSRLLDNVHVIRFRAIHSWVFVAAAAAMLFATVTHQPHYLWFSAVLQGIAFGGGMLAWNLGHHDFAPAHKASQYMGVHVTLTGIRGFLAPVLAVGLYQALNEWQDGAGAWVFAFCLALNFTGAVGFGLMHKRMTGRGGGSDFGESGPPVQPPAAG
jgi:MFS family permease